MDKLRRISWSSRTSWFLLGVLAVLVGQNCSSRIDGGATDMLRAPGNGGIYGGLTSQDRGSYVPGEETQLEPIPPPDFFGDFILARRNTNCDSNAASPSQYGSIANLISGILSIGTQYHRSSLCATVTASDTTKQLEILDFDTETLLYNNEIHFFYSSPPTSESELKFPIAYCYHLDPSQPSPDYGIAIPVYVKAGQPQAWVSQGKATEDGSRKLYIPPFDVSPSTTESAIVVTHSALELTIVRNGSRVTTGQLNARIDSQQVTQEMSCWLENP